MEKEKEVSAERTAPASLREDAELLELVALVSDCGGSMQEVKTFLEGVKVGIRARGEGA